jgi:hypothetical protein
MLLVAWASGGEGDAVGGLAVVQAPMTNASAAARPSDRRGLVLLNVAP